MRSKEKSLEQCIKNSGTLLVKEKPEGIKYGECHCPCPEKVSGWVYCGFSSIM